MIKIISSKQAVSEVIGVVLLLGITVTLFAIIQPFVLSFSFGSSIPYVNLIGTIDKTSNMIYIEHNGGESLGLTTDVIITIGSNNYKNKTGDLLIDLNHDNKWNFPETLEFSFEGINIIEKNIQVMVIESNAILLLVVLQKGSA
jgi:FlaG/FlaF family flagellin (archaellin)